MPGNDNMMTSHVIDSASRMAAPGDAAMKHEKFIDAGKL